MPRRQGLTLLELMVVLAILAVLVGLSLAAIMRAREAALRIESMNNEKQIILAIHHFAATNSNRLPSMDGNLFSVNEGVSLFSAILPYLDAVANTTSQDSATSGVKTYVSPADPTAEIDPIQPTSYAANAQVFQGSPMLTSTFRDGTSNTIAFAEHYSHCGETYYDYSWSKLAITFTYRRATFADAIYGDEYPITTGSPPTSVGDTGHTFQVAPAPKDCICTFAQTPHRGGMLVALADGSVHVLSAAVDPHVYWGMVTPAAGEIIANDW